MFSTSFLFSAGQDSIFFIYLLASQKQKNNIFLVTVNHLTQINSQLTSFHTIRLGIVLKQSTVPTIIIVSRKKNYEKTEKFCRYARYSVIKQIITFYEQPFLLTGHTSSDLFETEYLHFKKFFETPKNSLSINSKISFRKKLVVKKSYFSLIKKPSKFHSTQINTQNFSGTSSKITFSLRKKHPIILERPLKFVSRVNTFTITKTRSLPIFLDLTNFNNLVLRNTIRNYLIPFLLTAEKLEKK